jgi:alkanesulfonate monooxygenase SsuD/methylene tetrahydromethanopterin reductase-like flavin-dependent oxidoreductase (luciferase family)
MGTPQQVVDRIGEYERSGADWMILALRAPFDFEELHLFIREVMPKFPAGGPA